MHVKVRNSESPSIGRPPTLVYRSVHVHCALLQSLLRSLNTTVNDKILT